MDILIRFWLKYKKHLSKGILGIFFALTGAVGYFYMQEQNVPAPPEEQPKPWQPKEIVTPETRDFLTTYSAPVLPIHESPLAVIAALSVWEVRQGESAEELQRRAVQYLNEAKIARQSGNLDAAKTALSRALVIQPDFLEAKNLLSQIERELESNQ